MRITRILAACLVALFLSGLDVQAKELQYYVDKIQDLITKDNVQEMLVIGKKIKATGASYQHSITFPTKVTIVDSTDMSEDMRVMIGVYQFDALYAAAFGKKLEAAQFIEAKNELISKLNLKGKMDVAAISPPRLKQMLREPDRIDHDDIVAAYADSAGQFHKMMTLPEGFDVVEASMYGFLIEGLYVGERLIRQSYTNPDIRNLINEFLPNLNTIINLYETFEIDEDYAKYVDPEMFLEKAERLGWLKSLANLIQIRKGKLSYLEHQGILNMVGKKREELLPLLQ